MGGLSPGRAPADLDSIMQGLTDSPQKLAAFQRDLDAGFRPRGPRMHHAPHSVGVFDEAALSDGDSDSD